MTEQLNNNKKHTHLSLCIYIHQCNKMYLLQEMVTHSSILAWKILMVRRACQARVHGVTELDTTEQLTLSLFLFYVT